MTRPRFAPLLVMAGLLVALWAAPRAHAACEIDPGNDEATCGALNPPPVTGTTGGPPAPLVAWASGYDVNPFDGSRSGIWIAKIDGTARRRVAAFSNWNHDFEPHGLNLPEDHPSFSPDSRRLVFTSNRENRDDWDIHVMNVNGSGVTPLAPKPGLDTEPVFSPDGTKIAFATERFTPGRLQLAVMDADGTDVRRAVSSPDEDFEPAWRPDGNEIAFSRQTSPDEKDVWAVHPPIVGVHGETISLPPRQVTSVPGEDHDPTYSPSGSLMVITTERSPFDPPYGNVHPIRASDGADFGDLTGDLTLGAGDPFWSHDGQWIAFFHSSTRFIHSPQQLFVMRADGTGKFHIPGESSANIHPAMGLAVDDDVDGVPNYLESGSVGKAHLAPRRARAGRPTVLHFDWRHPRRWKRLNTLWLRLSRARWLLGMLEVSVHDRTVRVLDGVHDRWGPSKRLGRRGLLRSPLLDLDVRRSRFIPRGKRTLRLDLVVRVHARPRDTHLKLAGKRLRVRVQAESVGGSNQDEGLGGLRIRRSNPRR